MKEKNLKTLDQIIMKETKEIFLKAASFPEVERRLMKIWKEIEKKL